MTSPHHMVWDREWDAGGKRRKCRIFLPKGDAPMGRLVLCFLHGKGEAALHEKRGDQDLAVLEHHGSPAALARAGSELVRDCVVVCPQLEATRRWEPADASWIDEIIRVFGLDRARLVLTGFSFGGEGAFQIASASKLWKTIWAVDPALQRVPPDPPDGVRVWIHYGKAPPAGEKITTDFVARLALTPWSGGTNPSRVYTDLGAGADMIARSGEDEKKVLASSASAKLTAAVNDQAVSQVVGAHSDAHAVAR